MKRRTLKNIVLAGTLAATPAAAWANISPEELAELRDTVRKQQRVIDQQQSRLGALERTEDQTWLNKKRAQEVQSLVQEVLADADHRSSLQDGTHTTAGYKDGFFISSEDGKFLLRTNVLGQIRYVYSDVKNAGGAIGVTPTPAGGDEETNGFSLRNYRLDFRGHALTPDLTYRFRLTGGRSNADITYDHAYINYKFNDKFDLTVGNTKPKFLREENVSGYRQLALERSFTADYFTIDYSQLAELQWKATDKIRLTAAFHDGSYAGSTDHNADRTNFALAGRAEFLLAGKWNQFSDFTSWSTDDFGLLLGIGVDYENGENGRGTNHPDILKYTADISGEVGAFNFFAGIVGQNIRNNTVLPAAGNEYHSANQFGIVAQAGVHVVPDKLEIFGRYEYIDFDGLYYRGGTTTNTGTPNSKLDSLSIATLGANYYIQKHKAKFSVQGLYAFDPVPANSTGTASLLASPRSGQFALAGQFQFEF